MDRSTCNLEVDLQTGSWVGGGNGEKREINNDLDFLHKQLMEWRYLHIPELKNINSLQGD